MHFTKKNPSEKRIELKNKLKKQKILRFPGAYNPLTAKLIAEIGFDGVYISGAVMANDLGIPDIGLTTLKEVSYRANQISRVTDLPSIVDADTGFGDCKKTIETFEQLGLSGCHVEDQIDEKTIKSLSKAVKEISLVIESPQDYEYFTLKQQEFISTQLDGARKKIKARQSFVFSLISQLNTDLMGLQKMYQPMEKELKTLVDVYKIQNPLRPLEGNSNFVLFEVALALNLKVIHYMAKTVQQNGSKFVVVDATKSLPRYGQLPAALGTKIMEKFCELNNIGYIPLHDQLNKFNKEGVVTHWKYDWHFTEDGQKIFSNSMFDYLKKNNLMIR